MKDTSPEMKQLQFDTMMKLGVSRRMELAGEMFMAVRRRILASLPPDLSPDERIARIYRETYREDLPDDFFRGTHE